MAVSPYLFMVILIVLLLLVFLVWLYIKKRQQNMAKESGRSLVSAVAPPAFSELQKVIIDSKSSSETLEQAAEDIITYYGIIGNFNEYAALIEHMCRHRHITAKIVLRFEKALCNNNPEYARNIERTLQKALSSRRPFV